MATAEFAILQKTDSLKSEHIFFISFLLVMETFQKKNVDLGEIFNLKTEIVRHFLKQFCSILKLLEIIYAYPKII